MAASLTTACAGSAGKTETKAETTVSDAAVTEWQDGDITPDATRPIVIDFNASWCPPCRMFRPVFEKAAKARHAQAVFVSVNVDSHPDIARQFNVSSIPQISILMPDGGVTTATGYMDDDAFNAFLSRALPK